MKIKEVKTSLLRELNFLCSFILSDKFCDLYHKIFLPTYFDNSDYRILVGYVIKYYEHYGRPPKKLIMSYMERHKNKFQDDALYNSLKKTLLSTAETMDNLLEKYDSQWIIDDALLFIQTKALTKLNEEMQQLLDAGADEDVKETFKRFVLPELENHQIITFEQNIEKQKAVLSSNDNIVVQFKNEIGHLIGPLCRGDFFFWMAGTGTGKTWALQWTAKQCRDQGLNVLFLSLEMQEYSILRRFEQVFYRQTLYGESVKYPKFIKKEEGIYKIIYKEYTPEKLKKESIEELVIKAFGKHPHGHLKVVCQSALSVLQLKALLITLKQQQNFTPDVLCIDYADKMQASGRVTDERDRLGNIWRNLRDFALLNNLLIVTASQTNRGAWGKHFDSNSIAEDARKLNEASSAIGLMNTKQEKEKGLVLLRSLKTRDGYYEYRDVYCSSCLHIGQPFIQSVYAQELEDADLFKEAPFHKKSRKY